MSLLLHYARAGWRIEDILRGVVPSAQVIPFPITPEIEARLSRLKEDDE